MTLVAEFLERAEADPDRVALIDGAGGRLTFGALALRSARLAAAWRQEGLRRGDRVLVALNVGFDLYCALLGLWRLGAVAVFPEPAMGLSGVRHAARVAAPVGTLLGGRYGVLRFVLPELWSISMRLTFTGTGPRDPGVDATRADPALISFTSGSTGAPKAIERRHQFLEAQNQAIGRILAPTKPAPIDLVAFPIFALATIAQGRTAVLPAWPISRPDRVDASALRRHLVASGATRFLAPPSLCERLLEVVAPPRIDAIYTGGGPVFPDLIERLQTRIPSAELHAIYGATEAEPIAHLDAREIGDADWLAMRAGKGVLAGRPTPETRCRIDDGEILVAGAHVNARYFRATQNDGAKIVVNGDTWHRTGDAGWLDRTGRLWLRGRVKHRVGDICALGVEAAARFWQGVNQAAVTSLPSGDAVLVLEGDASWSETWRAMAERGGLRHVAIVDKIPMDRRHRSKVDQQRLNRALHRSMSAYRRCFSPSVLHQSLNLIDWPKRA